jgi:hypothetical protein
MSIILGLIFLYIFIVILRNVEFHRDYGEYQSLIEDYSFELFFQ